MTKINYYITRESNFNKMSIDNSLDGLDITPKNNTKYDGIVVSKLVVTNNKFIEKILKKKMKRKLELYLKFFLEYMSDGEDDGTPINQILNDIKRYKQILNYRYKKYLGEKYTENLMKKLELLEKEFTIKLYLIAEKQNEYMEENINSRRR